MDMQLSSGDLAFQGEVEAFLDANLDAELRRAGELSSGICGAHEPTMRWHQILHKKGWVAPRWPVEHGGTGWSDMQHYIWASACARAHAPRLYPMGVGMIGPTLAVCGTLEQQAHYLPKLLSGEHVWCQGYSEPGSGSDLASLQCKAERDGDDFIVNGTKIWTSYAHHANHIFCLVRTDNSGKPQQGISFLLIDMTTPGVSVTPIVTLAGDHEVNQVFFDNVRVPVANIVGVENEGWTVAKTLLTFERSSAYAARLMTRLAELQPLVAAAHEPALTMRFHDLEVRAKAIEMTEFRIQATLAAGQSPGAASSQMKIMATEVTQALDEVAMEALGYHGVPWQLAAREPGSNVQPIGEAAAPKLVADFFNNRAATIYGGSNEVQRNILAKAELGL